MAWVWLSLAIALFVTELSTTQLVSIWFASGAALTAIATAIVSSSGGSLPLLWQCVIFVLSSGIMLASTRKLVKRMQSKNDDQKTNLELNLNKTAVVTEQIDNDKEQGAIKINGLVWTARSLDGSIIEKDELVIFKEINGNKALVVKKEN